MSDSTHRPPRLAEWLLERLLPPYYGAVIGDFAEEYQDNVAAYGARTAALLYWKEILRSLPSYTLNLLIWSVVMVANYLKVTLRTLARYKGFSAINILGLAVSMAVCLVVILFIKDQKSYDQFHDNADRIYRVYSDYQSASNSESNLYATSPATLAEILRTEYPIVEQAVRLRTILGEAIANDKLLRTRGIYAEPSFFRIFDFDVRQGDAGQALAQPYSVILSSETAAKFFGDEDPVGQTLILNDTAFKITGVLQKAPDKSHLDVDLLISFSTLLGTAHDREMLATWTHNISHSYTFLLLEQSVDPQALAAHFPGLIAKHFKETEHEKLYAFHLQELTAINLGVVLGNQLSLVLPAIVAYFLAALGFIVMVMACFNYVGLSVARSIKRAREIGIRKVVGAHRSQVAWQFLGESVLLVFVALGVACVLLVWLVPAFNQLFSIHIAEVQFTGPQIDFRWADLSLYLLFVGFSVSIGLVAGLYPAFYLSSLNPVTVFKRLSRAKGLTGERLRKVLTVTQLSVSLFFMIMVALLYQQLQFMIQVDYGFDKEHVVNVDLKGQSYERFRQEIVGHPTVRGVSAMSLIPATGSRHHAWLQAEEGVERLQGNSLEVDEHFVDNLGLDLIAGRNFSADFSTDPAQAVLLNETAVRLLRLGTPAAAIDEVITYDGVPRRVIGVVRDFRYDLSFLAIGPLALVNEPGSFDYASVRIDPNDVAGTLAVLEKAWDTLDPVRPLDYAFMEEQLAEAPEMVIFRKLLGLIGVIALFSVFIACLGLLGMATYSAEVRVKEVGIRKVMGASVTSVVVLLSKDFARLIGVAVVLVVPLAWLTSKQVLQLFDNQMTLGVGIFVVSVSLLVVLALLTVGSQTMKAGFTNPVDTLRHE